ncbi:MAG: serpin family protein [Bacteroidales bacterium]|nr:serpin family protein [Bacteroidales bacterium]
MNIKNIIIICCAALFISFSSCKKHNEIKEIKISSKQQEIINSSNDFSLNIFREVNSTEIGKNFMISPLSIDFALAMTSNGAKSNTYSQMMTVLGFEGYSNDEFNEYFKDIKKELYGIDRRVDFSIANSIWCKNGYPVLESFLDINKKYYDAHIRTLDFSSSGSVAEINDWVSDNTNNKITKIIDNIPNDAIMYLINAIYFYGEWKNEFDASLTTNSPFYLENGETIDVDMMYTEADLSYYSDPSLTLVELPYGRGNFVMDIILPAMDTSIYDVVSNLDQSRWTELSQGLYETQISLKMPKFKFEYENQLIPMLSNLGMTDLFNPDLANLTGINESGGLYVFEVKHKTFIEVDEKGTEAAAVTSVGIGLTFSGGSQVIPIKIDRPFAFIIREKSTGVIIFTGVVQNPLSE